MMKKELNIFFNALMFFSRIPCPQNMEYSDQILSKAFRYCPLIGMIIAGIASALLWLSLYVLPLSISVLIALTVIVLFTGCLHEDGFSDFFDGFGGGTSKERILEIMKDSRIGTYGSMALILLTAFKYLSLVELPAMKIPIVLISAHSVSRVCLVVMVKSSSYAREKEGKALYTRIGVDWKSFTIAIITGLFPLIFFNFRFVVIYIFISLTFLVGFRHFLYRKISGFTGDTLGALQQFTEVIFYLTVISVPRTWIESSIF
jgi:adenosylcobinamide-GDP ribazoletransferase